jgi:hypothetical protein
MFTPENRDRVRSELLEYAAKDNRISAAAITGSATTSHEDQWSDVDLAFGVVDDGQLSNVLSDCTEHIYDQHSAIHHFDIRSGGLDLSRLSCMIAVRGDLYAVEQLPSAGREASGPPCSATAAIPRGWRLSAPPRSECWARRASIRHPRKTKRWSGLRKRTRSVHLVWYG